MSFKPKCGCVKHTDLTSDNDNFKVKKLEHRPYKKIIVCSLIENNLLDKRASYLCTICAQYSQKHLVCDVETPPLKKPKFSVVKTVIDDINNGEIDISDIINITETIGKSQKQSFAQEATEASKSYGINLESFNVASWLENRNIILLTFIKSLTGFDGSITDARKSLAVAAAIDCLMSAVNKCAISPLFFALNLTFYFICGSKTICNMLSAMSPAGSYSTIRNWFAKQRSEGIVCPSNTDVITFFDNSQVLARNWRVRYNAKAMLSVITSVVHIVPSRICHLQYQAELSPSSWLYRSNINVIDKIKSFIDFCNLQFQDFRDDFIKQRINIVYSEQKQNSDIIDDLIENPDIDTGSISTNTDPYSYLEHNYSNSVPLVMMGDPCMRNPCSYESVKIVIQHLQNAAKVGNERKWTIIGYDGLPYLLGSRLVDKHPELQDILIQPGLGHYEINMTKTCFKLLWDIALSDLGKLLGFKSIRAQTACQNANDHHKSWQILHIFLYGTSDEMILPYVRECITNDNSPTLHGYYSWLGKIKDPNYIFMKDAVFTYASPCFCSVLLSDETTVKLC